MSISVRTPRLPASGTRTVDEIIATLMRWLVSELGKRTPDDTVRQSLLLRSPDNSTWEITVDDLGAIAATKVTDA